MSIPICDLVLAGFIVFAAAWGWWAGTINVIGKLGSLLLAYVAARTWGGYLASLVIGVLPQGFNLNTQAGDKLNAFFTLFGDANDLTARLIGLVAFVLIFVVVCWLVRLIARTLTGLFGHGLLGGVNRALGGLLAGLLAVAVILLLSEIFFPAFADMGLGDGGQSFFAQSRFILPLLRHWLLA